MAEWIAAHQGELTLVLTLLLACGVFGIWASRKPAWRRGPVDPPQGPAAPKSSFHENAVKCGEGDITIDDALDRDRRRNGDGGVGGQSQ